MEMSILGKYSVKRNANFDILKFVLSYFIIAIHTFIFPKVLYPWLRIAVPTFFIMSSYFLFSKLNKTDDMSEKDGIVKKYLKRNLLLYAFWFVALSPVTFFLHGWFIRRGIVFSVLDIVRCFFFGSTFRGSWYLMALMIAVVVVYLLSKKFGNKFIIAVSFVLFFIVCFRTSYYGFVPGTQYIEFAKKYESIFGNQANSFPIAFIWVAIGKWFADSDGFNISCIKSFIFFLISCVLLFAEWYALKLVSGRYGNETYFMLIPVCIFLFDFVKKLPQPAFNVPIALRDISIINYMTNATVAKVLMWILGYFSIKNTFLTFLLTAGICVIIWLVISALENKKYFKWLRFSH